MEPAPDKIENGRASPVLNSRRVAADGCADDGKDAGTDDRADAKGGERDRAERLL